jgi:hypothetical protein
MSTLHQLFIKPTVDWARAIAREWDRFWFTPQQPHTLALIRILGGGMIFYTHLVWSLNLLAFLGPKGWLPTSTVALIKQSPPRQSLWSEQVVEGSSYAWSYLYYVDSPALLWMLHIAALIVLAMFTLGLFTRVTSILTFIITLSYCHRLEGSLFGLDQINALIATYVMLGQSGAVWSLDRWLAKRRGNALPIQPAIGTNIAIRLIQIHMCVIYLFGGIGKARGDTWWEGSALWFAFATLEYQSLDMVWTVHLPWLLALLTHITLFWELAYAFLIWPKLTRPIMLVLAVLVHAGIGLCMGMKTFGLMMIFANLAFVYPEYVEATVGALGRMLVRRTAPHVQKPPHMQKQSARHTTGAQPLECSGS